MNDAEPPELPPDGAGKQDKLYHSALSGEVLGLLTELRNDLLAINFAGNVIIDPATHLDYDNIHEFIDALVTIMANFTNERELDSILYVINLILGLLNNVQPQDSFPNIRTKINRIRSLIKGGGAPQGPGAYGIALQWTAMERLLDLIDK